MYNRSFSEKSILKLLDEIRIESKIATLESPKIIKTIYDENTLYIIVYDRPDKSHIVGYGGLHIKRLKKKLNVNDIVVVALADLMVKRYRIQGALAKINILENKVNQSIKSILMTYLKPLLLNELKYPPRRIEKISDNAERVVVAYSGGVDSSATLYILKKIGLEPIAITVNPGPYIVSDNIKRNIKHVVKKLNVEHHFIKPIMTYDEILKVSCKGNIMPCSLCNPIIVNSVIEYAKNSGIDIVFFGDSITTSHNSISFVNPYNILRVNLPGAMALTKFDMKKLVFDKLHLTFKYTYGCPLLRETLRKNRWMRFIAIERVLRETRAGILEPMEALRYIKNIVKLRYKPK